MFKETVVSLYASNFASEHNVDRSISITISRHDNGGKSRPRTITKWILSDSYCPTADV